MARRGEDGRGPQAGRGRHVSAEPAHDRTGIANLAEDVPGKIEAFEDAERPPSADGVVALRGRGDGPVDAEVSAEPVGEQVRHEEQPSGGAEERGPLLAEAQELVEGVERERLDAGGREDRFARHEAERLFLHARREVIAVMMGEAEESALGVEEREVDAPGVDAHAVNRACTGRGRGAKAHPNLTPDVRDVREESTRQPHGLAGEAMEFLEAKALTVEPPEHEAAAVGAEVDGDEVQVGGHRRS